MTCSRWMLLTASCAFLLLSTRPLLAFDDRPVDGLTVTWADRFLTIRGPKIPGEELRIWYIEAYCRPGSTNRAWNETVVGHTTELISASENGKLLKLKCTLKDGATMHHEIRAGDDEVDFRITASNPTDQVSLAHWAQPCIRVEKVTGHKYPEYLEKSFVFLDGKLARMPTAHWATKARHTPGQVWVPKGVDRNDVNNRPVSDLVTSNGLIGCFSADEQMITATAFEPYQELFQGVIDCLHSDFRIGGLKPGETKKIRGKIYIVPADVPLLLKRYQADFPEHSAGRQP